MIGTPDTQAQIRDLKRDIAEVREISEKFIKWAIDEIERIKNVERAESRLRRNKLFFGRRTEKQPKVRPVQTALGISEGD